MTVEKALFAQFLGKGVLLDSILLLVLLAGSVNPRLFGRFKRVSAYTIHDYELLVHLLNSFSVLLTTPHILTEVSNLANSLPEWYKPDWYEKFESLVVFGRPFPEFREQWIPASTLSARPEFSALGITDAAVVSLSSEALVLTDDRRLSGVLRTKGRAVLNFRDLRDVQELF